MHIFLKTALIIVYLCEPKRKDKVSEYTKYFYIKKSRYYILYTRLAKSAIKKLYISQEMECLHAFHTEKGESEVIK